MHKEFTNKAVPDVLLMILAKDKSNFRWQYICYNQDSTSPYHDNKQRSFQFSVQKKLEIDFQSIFLDSDTTHIPQANWQAGQWNLKKHDPIDKQAHTPSRPDIGYKKSMLISPSSVINVWNWLGLEDFQESMHISMRQTTIDQYNLINRES